MGERIEPRVGMKVRCVRRSKLIGGWFDGIGTVLSIDGGFGFVSGTIVVSVLEETPHSQCFDRIEWDAGDIIPAEQEIAAVDGENGGLQTQEDELHISGLGIVGFSPPAEWTQKTITTRVNSAAKLARVLFNDLLRPEARHWAEVDHCPAGYGNVRAGCAHAEQILERMWSTTMPDERKACEERAEYLFAEMEKLP